MTKIALMGDTHMGYSIMTSDIIEKKLKDLAKEKFDILIHTGDWISHEQDQLEPILNLFRNYVNTPILGVKGNHDFWNKSKPMEISKIKRKQKKLFKEYDILHLEKNNFKMDDITFWGFDGWYSQTNPPTNDKYFIPPFENGVPTNLYLADEAHKNLEKILSESTNTPGKKICVTHFPPYTFNQRYACMCANESYLKIICENFNYFIVGHSHQIEDFMYQECRVINPGGDYDKPNYKIIEVI